MVGIVLLKSPGKKLEFIFSTGNILTRKGFPPSRHLIICPIIVSAEVMIHWLLFQILIHHGIAEIFNVHFDVEKNAEFSFIFSWWKNNVQEYSWQLFGAWGYESVKVDTEGS